MPFFQIGMKTDIFQSCGHCWVFQICWHIECSTFTASSFRIWNSSTGIPSPPVALFIVMLSKAHLTSHSRKSGSRWVITPSWLSGSWRPFLYSSFVYSCHLFSISSASVRFIPLLSFIVPTFAWNVPLVSLIFLKRSLVFPILLFSSIYLHWLLKKAFLSLLAIIWNSTFKWVYLSLSPLLFASLLFKAICKASPDSHFAFCYICLICIYIYTVLFFQWKEKMAVWGRVIPVTLCFLNSSDNSAAWVIVSVQFSHSVLSDSLWPHGPQHARSLPITNS